MLFPFLKTLESVLLNPVLSNNNNKRQYVAAKMTLNKFFVYLLFILSLIVAVIATILAYYLNKNVSLDYSGKIYSNSNVFYMKNIYL